MIRNLNITFFTRSHQDLNNNKSSFRIIQSSFKNRVIELTEENIEQNSNLILNERLMIIIRRRDELQKQRSFKKI